MYFIVEVWRRDADLFKTIGDNCHCSETDARHTVCCYTGDLCCANCVDIIGYSRHILGSHGYPGEPRICQCVFARVERAY